VDVITVLPDKEEKSKLVAFREEAVIVDTVIEMPNMEEKRVEFT